MEVKVVREWFLYVEAGLFIQSFIVEVEDSVFDVVGIADLHVEQFEVLSGRGVRVSAALAGLRVIGIVKVTVHFEVLDEVNILLRFIGGQIVFFSVFWSTFEVVIKDDSLVIADDQVMIGYGEVIDGQVEIEFAEHHLDGIVYIIERITIDIDGGLLITLAVEIRDQGYLTTFLNYVA